MSIERDIGALQAQVQELSRRLDTQDSTLAGIDSKVNLLVASANHWRGGLRTLFVLGSVVATLGGGLVWVISTIRDFLK